MLFKHLLQNFIMHDLAGPLNVRLVTLIVTILTLVSLMSIRSVIRVIFLKSCLKKSSGMRKVNQLVQIVCYMQ